MANPNNITLRSEKGSFLTFEEMDLNFTELQNQLYEYNSFLSNDFDPLETKVAQLQTDWTDFEVTVNDQVTVIGNRVDSIESEQTTQDGRLDQLESDVASLVLIGWEVTTTATDKTIVNKERCTVTSAGVNITLPYNPSPGSEVAIATQDFENTTIKGNGSSVNEQAEDVIINKSNVVVQLYYDSTTWRTY